MGESDTSSIDHLVMREFVSGPPRYHLSVKIVREQLVILDQNRVSFVHLRVFTTENEIAVLTEISGSVITSPPDPINHVCSLTGKWISEKCFTYRSVQIFKIIFWRFLFSRIWSSAQDYVLRLCARLCATRFITQPSCVLDFHLPNRICQLEMICIGGVPISKRHFGGAGP